MSAYDMVNKVISEKLMEGVVPWKKLWKSKQGLPAISLNSGKPYSGINQLLLTCLAEEFTESPYFLTYKQAVARGGYIKKGEKGFQVVFFKSIDELEEDEKEEEDHKQRFVLRYYTIFNLAQCENISLTDREQRVIESLDTPLYNNSKVIKADKLLSRYQKLPEILHNRSYDPVYNYKEDNIKMPPLNQFESSEEYYSTIFHEIIHSTGHKNRLNRPLDDRSIQNRVLEELIAEIGSAYLSSDAGIVDKVIDNNASYINYWLDKININKRLFTSATSKAEKAYKFIITNSSQKQKRSA